MIRGPLTLIQINQWWGPNPSEGRKRSRARGPDCLA